MKDNVFKNKNFRLVFFGAMVSELGALLYSFAVSFYLLEISGNNALLQGVYLSVCGVVLLVFMPLGGVLGDRFSKAKIMYVCDYVKGALIIAATLGLILFKGANAQIAILFVVGIIGNAVSGIFSPAAGALLPEIVEEHKLQQANSYFSIKSSLQSILGIMLAGVLYSALRFDTLFMIVGACYIASGVSEMFIKCAHRAAENKLTVKLALEDMKSGIVYLKGQKAIMAMLASILFINFFFTPIMENFLPYFVKTDFAEAGSYLLDKLFTPELWYSVFGMLIGISSLVGAAILSAKPQAEKCGRAIALRLCAEAAVMLALAAGYWVFIYRGTSLNAFLVLLSVGSLITGYLITCINIPASTALMTIVDKDKLSKVNSIINIGSQGLIPVATALAGVIIQYMGNITLIIFSAVGFSCAAVFMLLNRHVKEF